MWNSGRKQRNTSFSPISGRARPRANRLKTRLRWENWMPLGVPVVPEVYITVARSSMRTPAERSRGAVSGVPEARARSCPSESTRPPSSFTASSDMTWRNWGRLSRLAWNLSSCPRSDTTTVRTPA